MFNQTKFVTSLMVAIVMVLGISVPSEAGETRREKIRFLHPHDGAKVVEKDFKGLVVTVTLTKAHRDDAWRVCAEFENDNEPQWIGSYRITDDSEKRDTWVAMTIGGKETTRRCETLNKQNTYYIILKKKD